jgi:DNA-binding PadR family transcriptional regulator
MKGTKLSPICVKILESVKTQERNSHQIASDVGMTDETGEHLALLYIVKLEKEGYTIGNVKEEREGDKPILRRYYSITEKGLGSLPKDKTGYSLPERGIPQKSYLSGDPSREEFSRRMKEKLSSSSPKTGKVSNFVNLSSNKQDRIIMQDEKRRLGLPNEEYSFRLPKKP